VSEALPSGSRQAKSWAKRRRREVEGPITVEISTLRFLSAIFLWR